MTLPAPPPEPTPAGALAGGWPEAGMNLGVAPKTRETIQGSTRRFPKANPDARLRLVQLNCTFLFDERKLSPDPLAPKGFAIGFGTGSALRCRGGCMRGPVLRVLLTIHRRAILVSNRDQPSRCSLTS